ncbi:unnamed protein product [Moneuplotes crassus]|uniref:Jacalin-type lectin domain-containing protein n=1 Tax=Euplotes crassus TaxID=5936 RepID=A0AAD2D4G1_EUPCR|nr:unnamed protein product [Moneuplotes crassus]
MGCGNVKQFPVYQKDEYPECVNLTFKVDDRKINPDAKYFDDNETLIHCKVFQISSVAVHMGEYIVGIAITLKVNGKDKALQHIGSGAVIDTEKLYMEPFEHIEHMKCTYSQDGLHSLEFKTNTERTLQSIGNVGEGEEVRELDLKEQDKALIGFRGCFKEHIYDIFAYIAVRLDILNDAADDDDLALMEAEGEEDFDPAERV